MVKQGKTISITIPEQLESYISKKAKKMGVSRSRYIATTLLNWQANKTDTCPTCGIKKERDDK